MIVQRETLQAAAAAGMLKYSQVDSLLIFLAKQRLKESRQPRIAVIKTALLYYTSGLFALAGAGLFAGLAVHALGVGALLWFSVLYGLCTLGVADWCRQHELNVPSAFFALLTVTLAALAAFALQGLFGYWNADVDTLPAQVPAAGLDHRWLVLELVSLAAAGWLWRRLRLPVLVLPVVFALWLIGLDLAPMLVLQLDGLFGFERGSSLWELRNGFTLAAGAILVAAGLYLEVRAHRRAQPRQAYLFWVYLAGLAALCSALLLLSGQMPDKLVYLVVHVGLVAIGVFFGRRIFQVFGIAGIALMVSDLSWDLIKGSVGFAPVLTVISLGLLALAVWWWRYEAGSSARLRQGQTPQGNVRRLPVARSVGWR